MAGHWWATRLLDSWLTTGKTLSVELAVGKQRIQTEQASVGAGENGAEL